MLHCTYLERSACVRTVYGNSPDYHPDAGLDQGKVTSPSFWNIFYDPLLCYLQAHCPAVPITDDPDGPTVNVLPFADDTNLIANSPASMDACTAVCHSYATLHSIVFKPAKCVHISNHVIERTPDKPPRIGPGPEHIVQCRKGPRDTFTLLGVSMTLNCSSKGPREVAYARAKSFAATLESKKLHHYSTQFILNCCVNPALYHGVATTPLDHTHF